jgi:nuclear pore complex protein Nup54
MSQQSQQQPGGLFSGLGQSTQPKPGFLGGLQSTQQPQQSAFGQTTSQQQQPQTLQLGQSQQSQLGRSQGPPSIWEEGRGLGGKFELSRMAGVSNTSSIVYRTIPAQMLLVKEKWDPNSLASPLRTYLYQVVDEQNAPFYQPGPGEDENKWEEAVSRRPGPQYVPALVRGFWDLGKRAQRQREFIEKINIRLHDISQSLDAQLEIHSQKIAARLVECRRKHVVASQRTLALATKIQILRNRGYVMDNAEEDLKMKLSKLEKEIFDPSLNGREQEIWARMLGIRERAKRLQREIDRTAPVTNNEDSGLDEAIVQAAKKVSFRQSVRFSHAYTNHRLLRHMMCNCDTSRRKRNLFKRSMRSGRRV